MSVHHSRNRDINTLSNYSDFVTTHTRIDCRIDFDEQIIFSVVTLSLQTLTDANQEELILDTKCLSIVGAQVNDEITRFELLSEVKPYGRALRIPLSHTFAKGDGFDVKITCQTTQDGSATQFMTPTQANSEHPYMFTQCQAIHARSIFPCQDTPDVKSTFTFHVTSVLPVLVSGLPTGSKDLDGRWKQYNFEQPIPIPSYLFALASGDIETAPIGPRSVVAAGPGDLKACQWEFEESTENFIQTIENIIFPYQWKTYNLLVLVPSFPFGGMENCNYNFLTDTLISGDRENVDTVAHELSHSYSGNLVTNASWEHFWLNEGWTTYLERRIQAALYGESHRDFQAIIGWKALEDSITTFGPDHEFTKLIPNLQGKDPDDAFSSVPYEKGYTFISYLEAQVGREAWNSYIKHYFTAFARKSLDSFEFKADLFQYFASNATASAALHAVNWDEWFYAPGLPPKPNFDTSLVDVCYTLASKWAQAEPSTFQPTIADIEGWRARQVVGFLEKLQDLPQPLDKRLTQKMGKAYGLAASRNVEVVARYLKLGLMAGDEGVYGQTVELLGRTGRMKFVRPLYKQLNKADRRLALDTFERNTDFYHPICRALVEKDLGIALHPA